MIIKSIKYNPSQNAIIATCDGNFGRVHEEVVTKQVIQAMSEYLANLSIKTGKWINGCCSECDYPVATDTRIEWLSEIEQHYCYNCGARMEGEVNAFNRW